MTSEEFLRALKKSTYAEVENDIVAFQMEYDTITDKNIKEYSDSIAAICEKHYWSYDEYCERYLNDAVQGFTTWLHNHKNGLE